MPLGKKQNNMVLNTIDSVKRLVIYFFYDKDGIVDDYVPYMLDDVRKNCSELFVVCNGKLTSEGRTRIEKYSDHVMVRENKGFDVWAYKTALDYYGWDVLETFDEVVLMNFTIMGPVYPFSEMFSVMNAKDLDFWGINKYHKYNANPYDIPYGYIPEHIQSHFIVIRNKMIKSPEFQEYWNNRPPINSYYDAIGKHEAIFTRYFSDKGFKWETYVNSDKYEGITPYPLFDYPVNLIKENRCPIFKRKNFFHPLSSKLVFTVGNDARELLRYLDKNTTYNVDMVWQNLLRTNNLADIKDCLALNYILPDDYCYENDSQTKVALIIHIYFEDQIDYCLDYAMNMPQNTDLIITTDSEDKKKKIQESLSLMEGLFNTVNIEVIKNRGRDVSALLIGAKQYLHKYDLVCFVHDKKVSQLAWGCSGKEFSDKCFENLLGTKEYVSNIISLFDKNKRLGMVYPPVPIHAEYYSNIGNQWGDNYKNTIEWKEKLGIKVIIDEEKEVVAPLGTMFWFRPEALKKISNYEWKYEDFPNEPNKINGTILHAIERLYSYCVQDAGYYVASVLRNDYAQLEMTNLEYMNREVSSLVMKKIGYNYLETILYILKNNYIYMNNKNSKKSIALHIKLMIYRILPPFMWNTLRGIYRNAGGTRLIHENIGN